MLRPYFAKGFTSMFLLLVSSLPTAMTFGVGARLVELELRRRDPNNGEAYIEKLCIAPSKLGIVVVDMWNYHCCKTAAARAEALTERINYALKGARSLGMQVILAPTDVADTYVGTPQREYIESLDQIRLPVQSNIDNPDILDGVTCMCGPGLECILNYGWDSMHPKLNIAEQDIIVGGGPLWAGGEGTRRLYAVCRDKGLTHLIYMGVHTNLCVLGKSIGMLAMAKCGIKPIIERTMTDAGTAYIPDKHNPDDGTAEVIALLERQFCASVDLAAELRSIGLWSNDKVVDPVRITPWGKLNWPHQFEKKVFVTLRFPMIPQACIYYTLDGAEPTSSSTPYERSFALEQTTMVRCIAYKNGEKVSLPSKGYFVRLPARPPLPDVYISDLKPVRQAIPNFVDGWRDKNEAVPPRKDRSYADTELMLRKVRYAKGIGMKAPGHLVYTLESKYRRFVALAGVDESLLAVVSGRGKARYPSVVFRVFIDGKLVAESPIMRISQEPWRFDIPIPTGCRKITLAATDAGSRSDYDLANWVNAGFVLNPPNSITE